jgi:hypothetical protein
LASNGGATNDSGGNGAISITYNPAVPTSMPTISGWGLMILSCLLAWGAIFNLRRQRQ